MLTQLALCPLTYPATDAAHCPCPGYSDGYPLLFDTHLTERRAAELLTFAKDGGYLSAVMSQTMTLEVGAGRVGRGLGAGG